MVAGRMEFFVIFVDAGELVVGEGVEMDYLAADARVAIVVVVGLGYFSMEVVDEVVEKGL